MNSKKKSGRLRIWLAVANLFICLIGGTVSAYAQDDMTAAASAQTEASQTENPEAQSEENKKDKEAPTGGEGTVNSGPNTNDSGDTVGGSVNADKENDKDKVPEGNLTISEDIVSGENGSREFLTVYSKQGDVFYIIINRDNNGNGNVYFLNTVDDTDLYSLTGQEAPAAATPSAPGSTSLIGAAGTENIICTCTDKCEEGHVNSTCPLCRLNLEECEGVGGSSSDSGNVTDPSAEPEQKPELNIKSLIIGGTALIFLVILYFAKIHKPKKKAPAEEFDMDEFYLDDEDDEE